MYSEHPDPLEWLKQTALQSQSTVEGNVMTLNPSIGNGYVKQVQIEKGFNFNITDLFPTQKIPIHQQPTNASRLVIKLYLPDLHYDTTIQKGLDPIIVNEPGITISSSHYETHSIIRANGRVRMLAFVLSFEWIKSNLNSGSFILNEHVINTPLFLFEKASPQIFQTALNIFETHVADYPYPDIRLKSAAYELLAMVLSVFDYRHQLYHKPPKNQKDINTILLVKEKLLTNLEDNCPTITALSKEFALSPTKLKSLFRTVFGLPVFSFFQKERLAYARRLIESRNYNVSEAGLKVGYNNLSKFSHAYHKEFGFPPKDTLKSDRAIV